MQPLEIDSAVFCDGAHYTIISRENSSILTCPVANGAHGYTLNRAEGGGIDREIGRLTGHAACIAVDVPTWCRIAGDPLDAVADALADLLDETPSRFELEQLAAASPLLRANTPGIPVFPEGIAPAANSYTLAGDIDGPAIRRGCPGSGRHLRRAVLRHDRHRRDRYRRDRSQLRRRAQRRRHPDRGRRLSHRGRREGARVLRVRGHRRGLERLHARGPGRRRRRQAARRRGPGRIVRHAVAQHGRPLPRGAPRCRVARALPLDHRPVRAGPRRQEGRGLKNKGRGRRARAGALGTALPVREHAFTRRADVYIIRATSAPPPPSRRRTA